MYSFDDVLNEDIDEIDRDDNVHHDEAEEDQNIFNDNDNENEEVKKDEKDEDKPAKKVRKQSQRPLLNAERLRRPRGLICMEKIFSKLKFRGHGREQEDLDMVMTSLQHWCHRLYPKFTFDDAIEQIEKLGIKKPVMTLRKKIIMNMLDDEIFGDVKLPEDQDEPVENTPPSPVQDQFDLLLEQDRPPPREKQPSPELEITEEQIQIMERNRLLAAEKRKARLEAQAAKEKAELENRTLEIENQNTEIGKENTGLEDIVVLDAETEVPLEKENISANNEENLTENENVMEFEETEPTSETEILITVQTSSQDTAMESEATMLE